MAPQHQPRRRQPAAPATTSPTPIKPAPGATKASRRNRKRPPASDRRLLVEVPPEPTCHIDAWLAELFDPDNIDHTIAQLTQPITDDAPSPRADMLQRTIAQMDQKLARYREALAAGTNPALIATWTAEIESARTAAETELANLAPAQPKPIQNVPALIASIRDEWGTMAEALGAADGTRKAELLSSLGVLVSYDPLTHKAQVTCCPKVSESVVSEGGHDSLTHLAFTTEFAC